jgi:hypothetical protein
MLPVLFFSLHRVMVHGFAAASCAHLVAPKRPNRTSPHFFAVIAMVAHVEAWHQPKTAIHKERSRSCNGHGPIMKTFNIETV